MTTKKKVNTWKLVFWNGNNFRKWKWYNPCECGCDSREDARTFIGKPIKYDFHFYLEKYFSGGLGLFGFTLKKYVMELKEMI